MLFLFQHTQKYIDEFLRLCFSFFTISIDSLLNFLWLSPRFISIAQLNTLLHLHLQPIYQLVFLGFYLLIAMGKLILEGASRLDAFSVYPFPTQLLCAATGVTTDTPEVGPSRSSRTKDSSPQFSCAHDGQGPNFLTTF